MAVVVKMMTLMTTVMMTLMMMMMMMMLVTCVVEMTSCVPSCPRGAKETRKRTFSKLPSGSETLGTLQSETSVMDLRPDISRAETKGWKGLPKVSSEGLTLRCPIISRAQQRHTRIPECPAPKLLSMHGNCVCTVQTRSAHYAAFCQDPLESPGDSKPSSNY